MENSQQHVPVLGWIFRNSFLNRSVSSSCFQAKLENLTGRGRPLSGISPDRVPCTRIYKSWNFFITFQYDESGNEVIARSSFCWRNSQKSSEVIKPYNSTILFTRLFEWKRPKQISKVGLPFIDSYLRFTTKFGDWGDSFVLRDKYRDYLKGEKRMFRLLKTATCTSFQGVPEVENGIEARPVGGSCKPAFSWQLGRGEGVKTIKQPPTSPDTKSIKMWGKCIIFSIGRGILSIFLFLITYKVANKFWEKSFTTFLRYFNRFFHTHPSYFSHKN